MPQDESALSRCILQNSKAQSRSIPANIVPAVVQARSLSRHSSSSRPSTPSEALPAGTAPVGPLGRPSTPRSLGQPVLQGKAIGTPLMNQRPLSARSSGTEVVMKPEQYEASLVEFTDTMNQYQMQMQVRD